MRIRKHGEWEDKPNPVDFHTREFSDRFLSEVLADYTNRVMAKHGEKGVTLIGLKIRQLVVADAETHWGLSIDSAVDIVVPQIWRLFAGDKMKFTEWVDAHLIPLGADQKHIARLLRATPVNNTMEQEKLF